VQDFERVVVEDDGAISLSVLKVVRSSRSIWVESLARWVAALMV